MYMFQTHTFQAFNTSSLANLTCSIKLSQTLPDLSLITLQYSFGLNEKYRLTLSENDLSNDMKLVVNNLKGFYDYLKYLHQTSDFKNCSFTKNMLTVSFLLKIFNHQEKLIRQQFKSTQINDQVLWQSELKSKMDQLQNSLTKSMFSEMTRKIKDQILQEKEMSILKINALDKKVTRELQNVNKKIEMVFNLINNKSSQKIDSNSKVTRHRGRFQEENENTKKNSFLNNETINQRIVRRQGGKTKLIFKTQQQKGFRPIQKNQTIQPFLIQKVDNHKSQRYETPKKSNQVSTNCQSIIKVNEKVSVIDQKSQDLHDFRNKFFQKNVKKAQMIDLEDEEEMKKFKIRITNNKEDSQKAAIKREQGNLVKNNLQQLEKKNGKQSKQINNRPAKQNVNFIDQIMNSDSQMIQQRNQQDSSQQVNRMAKIVESFKKKQA